MSGGKGSLRVSVFQANRYVLRSKILSILSCPQTQLAHRSFAGRRAFMPQNRWARGCFNGAPMQSGFVSFTDDSGALVGGLHGAMLPRGEFSHGHPVTLTSMVSKQHTSYSRVNR